MGHYGGECHGNSVIHDDDYITDAAAQFGFQDYPDYTFRLFFASDLALDPDQLSEFDYNDATCGNVCFTFPSDPDTAYADPVNAAPASLALLGSALAGLGVIRRRKRKAD